MTVDADENRLGAGRDGASKRLWLRKFMVTPGAKSEMQYLEWVIPSAGRPRQQSL
jgi:hypothetical protein